MRIAVVVCHRPLVSLSPDSRPAHLSESDVRDSVPLGQRPGRHGPDSFVEFLAGELHACYGASR